MATYTVTGHPLNYADLGLVSTDAVRIAVQDKGVGQTVTFTLSGPDDTKAKAHGVVR